MPNLDAFHAWGDIDGQALVAAVPPSRFSFLVDEYQRYDKDKDETIHYSIIIGDQDTERIVRATGVHTKFIKPYHPGDGRDAFTIYFKGKDPEPIVSKFTANLEGSASYVNKEGFGFVKLSDDFEEAPLLVGILRFMAGEGDVYNFARPKVAQERVPKWDKSDSSSDRAAGSELSSAPTVAGRGPTIVKETYPNGSVRRYGVNLPTRQASARPVDR